MRINTNGTTFFVDGKSFSGKSISIINGKVILDGIEQPGSLVGDISVTVDGNVDRLENLSGNVYAQDVNAITTQSGNVACGDVGGSVSTMSGDVNCHEVKGSVQTMSGDITRK